MRMPPGASTYAVRWPNWFGIGDGSAVNFTPCAFNAATSPSMFRGAVGDGEADAVDDAPFARLWAGGAKKDPLDRQRTLARERLEHDASGVFAGHPVEIARVPLRCLVRIRHREMNVVVRRRPDGL